MTRKPGNRLLTRDEASAVFEEHARSAPQPTIEVKENPWPADWVKGQLLNVRNAGDRYCVTLLGEEFDPRKPERALHFANSYECNHFLGYWYARDTGRQW